MTTTKAGPISADRLKSFIERIERMEEERKAISGDIRDIYSEAKGVGYDVKTMRRIVQLRKKDAAERDEEEQLLDMYAHALGMVFNSASMHDIGHNSPREPTEDELMDQAARVLKEVDLCATHLVTMDGKPPKIEAIKRLIGCSTGKAHKLRAMVIERLEGFSPTRDLTVKNENADAAGRSPGDEGEENGKSLQHSRVGGSAAGDCPADDGDGKPVADTGQQQAAPVGSDRPSGGAAGAVRAAAEGDQWRQGPVQHRATVRDAGFSPLARELDGRADQSAGDNKLAAERTAVATIIPKVDRLGDAAGHRSEPSHPAEQLVNPGPPSRRVSPVDMTGKEGNPATISDPDPWDSVGEMPSHLRRTPTVRA